MKRHANTKLALASALLPLAADSGPGMKEEWYAMAVTAVASLKGGLGKAVSVIDLAAARQEAGKRVLVGDFGPQASVGHVLRAAASGNRRPTLRDILIQAPAELDLVPAGGRSRVRPPHRAGATADPP
jgi:hypothetical protein